MPPPPWKLLATTSKLSFCAFENFKKKDSIQRTLPWHGGDNLLLVYNSNDGCGGCWHVICIMYKRTTHTTSLPSSPSSLTLWDYRSDLHVHKGTCNDVIYARAVPRMTSLNDSYFVTTVHWCREQWLDAQLLNLSWRSHNARWWGPISIVLIMRASWQA